MSLRSKAPLMAPLTHRTHHLLPVSPPAPPSQQPPLRPPAEPPSLSSVASMHCGESHHSASHGESPSSVLHLLPRASGVKLDGLKF